jgi:hypothetical protein
MQYPWSLSDADPRLDQALTIAMQYLELKGLADDYYTLEKYVALLILNEWQRGVRHPLRLSRAAIAKTEALLKPHEV